MSVKDNSANRDMRSLIGQYAIADEIAMPTQPEDCHCGRWNRHRRCQADCDR
jgi:hypothetical protein